MTVQQQLPGFTPRQLLDYCSHGSQKMRDDPVGPDWVLAWGGTIALLRAIGHALANVDAAADPALAAAQKEWWKNLNASKPHPLIFWEFIERDRNLFLKEATLRAGQSGMTTLPGLSMVASAAGQKPPPPPPAPAAQPGVRSYQMNAGHFAGRDPRDLVDEAIAWWDRELTALGL